jgi:hypothetical protein
MLQANVKKFRVQSEVWLYPSATAVWHFASLSKKQSEEITKRFGAKRRGWNSFPVSVSLGKTKWMTSIFFDKRAEVYILPLKASIRRKEEIYKGDKITFVIEIRV